MLQYFIWTKKNFQTKNFFFTKNFFGPKIFFGTKIFLDQNFFFDKIFFYQKFFLPKFIFYQNFFFNKNLFRPTIFSDQNFSFRPKIFQTPDFFWTKISFSNPKFFQTQNFFQTQKFFQTIFFGPKILFDAKFIKPFQTEHFRLSLVVSYFLPAQGFPKYFLSLRMPECTTFSSSGTLWAQLVISFVLVKHLPDIEWWWLFCRINKNNWVRIYKEYKDTTQTYFLFFRNWRNYGETSWGWAGSSSAL